MGEAPELLLGPLAVGDVLVRPGDAAHAAVGVVHRGGGEAHVDKGAVLAPAPDLDVADALAVARPLVERAGFCAALRRHDLDRRTERLLGGVAVELLGGAAPQ